MSVDVASAFGPRATWIGVYDALSARLVGSFAGTEDYPAVNGLWISSYCVSAALRACPDASIVGSAEMMSVARHVAAASPSIPIVIDCDSGYGDATVFGFVAREIARTCSTAAVCIEDKAFPKRNSFYVGWDQELESVESFQEKIESGRRAAHANGETLRIVARTEALVLGAGVDEALRRMSAYIEAGADAVMVQATGRLDEMVAVGRRWKELCDVPLIGAPTAFPEASAADFWSYGYDVYIYANHLLRRALEAQQELLAAIHDPSVPLAAVQQRLWTIEQLNKLVGASAFSRDGADEPEADSGASDGLLRA